ncbi:hypothetical protein GGQ99_000993 [Aminobacter niigataensis]|uniref:DUF982 domain-containing protein n=1 Tax=Aminobacter niigataensis TaxID=83265 RepID=A0ABR6KXK8_9HYPH|nr:DUF982 domain-containing protein [Aminobacter niigataensis]MBB4649271.1 hypothetical protein [Aminobacter niigataensis]
MMWFWPPVPVKVLANPGHTYDVKAVEVCIEQLETWPKRTAKWRKAYKTCFDALEGMATAADARKTFEAAAIEAGVLRQR